MTTAKPTTSFYIISITALLWNLIGIMAFAMDVTMSTEAMEALPEAQRELYENTPAWFTFIYGVAVFGGTAGCIFLLLKRAIAYKVFLISLIAVLIQVLYSVFFTNSVEAFGKAALIMPVLVICFAIFLVWYSRSRIAKGVLR